MEEIDVFKINGFDGELPMGPDSNHVNIFFKMTDSFGGNSTQKLFPTCIEGHKASP